jgi:hypothetical protein
VVYRLLDWLRCTDVMFCFEVNARIKLGNSGNRGFDRVNPEAVRWIEVLHIPISLYLSSDVWAYTVYRY